MNIKEQAANIKLDSAQMACTSLESRNRALSAIAKALIDNKESIFQANQTDLEQAQLENVAAPLLKRLKFNQEKLDEVTKGILDLTKLPDPLSQVQMKRELDTDLLLVRESCPIGVIGVIFEARPDAMVQISALCLKSGNCAILKGGSEAMNTNRVLFQTIYQAAVNAKMPKNCLFQVEARSEIDELLACHESVDLLIPRGSNEFVQYIMNHSKIPVMGHADGICHIYVDRSADISQAISVIVDSKTQYTAVCNAAETLLVHKDIASQLLPRLHEALLQKHVEVKGTKEIQEIIDCGEATEEDFHTEYLDLILSIKMVSTIEEAIMHINKYGSHHTDCILAQDSNAATLFMQRVDSAGVYQNCSTRFADGYRYGFGAEVGISTGKLHARGPVGLEGLCTYKYKLTGNGNIVADYAEGKRQFHFKDIQI